jgi:CBS domain-containing protein/pSer/pThr/pTyr-binding forkhead associated (FHA) protein
MTGEIILTIENGPLAGNDYVFKEDQLCIIGRGEDCDIRLPAAPQYRDVSRHHCLLAIELPRVSVSDLSSRNGTRVNGVLIGRRTEWPAPPNRGANLLERFRLCDGDQLEVGSTVFRVHVATVSDSPPQPVAPENAGAQRRPGAFAHLALDARTAADLMTTQVVTIAESATVLEAEALLRDRELSAVPVLGAEGDVVGVLSRADVIAFDCDEKGSPPAVPDVVGEGGATIPPADRGSHVLRIEDVGPARVRDIMTQVVFSVEPHTPAARVVEAMLSLRVHRLFVIEPEGNLVGVVSMTDVLRHLHQAAEVPV